MKATGGETWSITPVSSSKNVKGMPGGTELTNSGFLKQSLSYSFKEGQWQGEERGGRGIFMRRVSLPVCRAQGAPLKGSPFILSLNTLWKADLMRLVLPSGSLFSPVLLFDGLAPP